jgi:hypothetical protein
MLPCHPRRSNERTLEKHLEGYPLQLGSDLSPHEGHKRLLVGSKCAALRATPKLCPARAPCQSALSTVPLVGKSALVVQHVNLIARGVTP